MKKTLKILFVVAICVLCSLNTEKTIVTKSKNFSLSKSEGVSTRELAMISALAYEYVPNDSTYISGALGKGCRIDTSGKVVDSTGKEDNCFFIESDKTAVVKSEGKKYNVKQYLEGFSLRKKNSLVGILTGAAVEDGQRYYFMDVADVSEMASSWSIVNATDERSTLLSGKNISFAGVFSAITFHKKGTNNYVIAYRGTDLPDILEWLQDVRYMYDGTNGQTALAYQYAQKMYKAITADKKDANIYVTGHSLGGYLAQVGGAAIVDLEAGIDNTSTTNYNKENTFNSLKAYTDFYTNKNSTKSIYNSKNSLYNNGKSRLKQVAYFNAMGVSGALNGKNIFVQNIDNALTYLGTHELNGTLATDKNTLVSYSDTIAGSGRLVLYSVDSDPISTVGVHYGQIYKIEASKEAINNHVDNHSALSSILKLLLSGNLLGTNKQLTYDTISNYVNSTISSVPELVSSKTEILKYLVSNSKQILEFIKNINESANGLNADSVFVPSVVANEIRKSGNYQFDKHSLWGVIKNMFVAGKDFMVTNIYNNRKSYDIKNLGLLNDIIAWANINHETDSFACLLDSKNGYIKQENVEITISAPKMKLINNIWYTKADYNSSSNYIKLTVSGTKGACVDLYKWNIDGTEYITTDNSIVIPSVALTNGKTLAKTIKLTLEYGDHYTEAKVNLVNNNTIKIEPRNKGTWVNTNPTIKDNIKDLKSGVNKEINVEQRIQINLDKTAPQSNVTSTSLNVSKGKSFSYTFNFIDSSSISFSSISTSLSKAGLLRKNGFESIGASCNASAKTCTVTGKAIKSGLLNNLLANNNQTVTFKVTAKDLAGNTTNFTGKISLKRK